MNALLGVLDKLEAKFASGRDVAEQFSAATRGTARAVNEAGQAATRAAPKMGRFTQSILRIAKYRMIRSIIRGITKAIQEGTENFYNFSKAVGGDFAKAMDEARNASSKLKNQLGSAFGELYTSIQPVLIDIINLVTRLVNWLTMLFAALRGQGGWYRATAAAKDYGDAVAKAGAEAKEAMRYLAPFDELNRLPSKSSGGGGGGTPDGGGYEFVPFEGGGFLDTLSTTIRENFEAIEMMVDVFTFAVGAILALSGANIPLGIGMMVLGAYKYYQDVSTNWNAIKEQLEGPLGEVTALISSALLVLGVLSIVGNHIPLGMGLIIAGAMGLGTVTLVNWNAIKEKLENPIAMATALVSGALLVLGIFAAVAQKWPLAIALIVAGSAGLGSVALVNWNAISDKIKGPIADGIDIVSKALLLLGVFALLCQKWPLGLGLIVAGAAGLSITGSLNWNAIKEGIEKPVEAATQIIAGALLFVGVVALLAQKYALGICLIATGAVGLATSGGLNWNAITDAISDPIARAVLIIEAATMLIGVFAIIGGHPEVGIPLIAAAAVGMASGTVNFSELTKLGADARDAFNAGWNGTENLNDTGGIEPIEIPTQIVVELDEDENYREQLKDRLRTALGLDDGSADPINVPVDLVPGNFGSTGGSLSGGSGVFNDMNGGLRRNTVSYWVASLGGKELLQPVTLKQQGWKTVTSFVSANAGATYNKPVGLLKNQWTYVSEWLKDPARSGGVVNKAIGLIKNGWSYLSTWALKYAGGMVNKPVGLIKNGWSYLSTWALKYAGGNVNKPVGVAKNGWTNLADWMKQSSQFGGVVSKSVTLSGVISSAIATLTLVAFVATWNSLTNKTVTLKVNLDDSAIGAWNSVVYKWNTNTPGRIYGNLPYLSASNVTAGASKAMSVSYGSVSGYAAPLEGGLDEEALYRAMSRALSENAGEVDVNVNLDGDNVYQTMVRKNRQNTRRTGVNAFA